MIGFQIDKRFGLHSGTASSHLAGVTEILEARGFSVIGAPRRSFFPRPSSLMTADVIDRSGNRIFIKIGRSRIFGPSRLYKSHKLLMWLMQAGFNNNVFTFPKSFGYFCEKGLAFLMEESVDHLDFWSNKTPIERFLHFSEVIAALKQIQRCPRSVDRYDHRTVAKILTRYVKYIRRHTQSVDHAALTHVLKVFRSNRQLFDRFDGVFSHNDIQAANLLCRSIGDDPKFCLVDVETCRVGNAFADFARCYNRELLTSAQARFKNPTDIRDIDFGEAYSRVTTLYNDDKDARKMFDIMILVDALMHLYWTMHHEPNDQTRLFVDKWFSKVIGDNLAHC